MATIICGIGILLDINVRIMFWYFATVRQMLLEPIMKVTSSAPRTATHVVTLAGLESLYSGLLLQLRGIVRLNSRRFGYLTRYFASLSSLSLISL